MKTFIVSFAVTAFATLALAGARQKSVVITYPSDTPDSVVGEAKDAILKAGGVITHEYKLIKAFAAKAPEKALNIVHTMETQYNAVIEEDQVVTVQHTEA